MHKIPKRYWWGVGIWVALFSFYSITAWQQLPWPVFSSPDETANYAFAQQARATGSTYIPTTAPGAPRSVINTGTRLVPGSFVFFPHLLGFVGKVSGTFGMLMFGPALAASAVLAWFFFTRRVFGSRTIAWVSTVFLASFPTFWFYAGRGLWQNGVFTSLLILSIAATAWAWRTRFWGTSAVCGLVWGITVVVRPSEFSWIAPGVIVGLLLAWRYIPWRQVGVATLCAFVPTLCLVLFQWQTYESPAAIGYRPAGAFSPAPIVQQLNTFQQVKNVFFPFGTNPRTAWEHFRDYGVQPVSYAVLPGLAGLLWLAWRSPRPARHFLAASAVSGVFLVLLYGNYRFIEYPAVREAVLDGSYLRYWLPLAILLALGWGGAIRAISGTRTGRTVGFVLLAGALALNVTLLVSDRTIGLAQTTPRIREAQAQSRWIIKNTPADAVVIAGSRDKLVFPRRHAIGFDGTVPASMDLGDDPDRLPTYILLSNAGQVSLLENAFPTLVGATPVIGPAGLALVRLQTR
ncbi:MAG: hypothetical protein AAB445_00265 [Patescibacteria group bacterium]